MLKNINHFNQILFNQENINVIKVKNKLNDNSGIAKDHIHLNLIGHNIFAKSFLELI